MATKSYFGPSRQTGVSLIELMVGLTIGLLIATALVTLFSNISYSNREQFKASMQLENGRYAMDLLGNDIRLAGFYGDFGTLPKAVSLPDPCNTALFPEGTITDATTTSPLAFYLQTYTPSSLTTTATIPTSCAAWLDSSTLAAGSDILIVRRLDTTPLIDPPTTTSATPVSGQLYAQTNNRPQDKLDLQLGSGAAIDASENAKGAATSTDMQRKDFSQAASPLRPTIAAYIRKLHVHVYFVAKCRNGSGSNGKCTAADDTIPTLKRIELAALGGAPIMTLVSLVEGVEFMRAYLGSDTDGNGQVDGVLTSQPATVADWQNVVQTEIRILARNTESSAETDTKTYDLGNLNSFTPSGAAAKFKRHLYTQQIYITNIAGRREI